MDGSGFRRASVGRTLTLMAYLVPAIALGQATDVETLNTQADKAYRARNFPATIELTEKVLADDPENHVALYLRGSARVELGIANRDAESIRQGIADTREAIRHEGSGKPDYYLPYIYGMSHLAGLEGKRLHGETARSVADTVLERTDLTPTQRANLYYQRAHANLQLAAEDAAEQDLQDAIDQDAKHLASYMLLADIARRSGEEDKALSAFNRVVTTFPENPLAYNNRGMFHRSQGRLEQALADFDRALQLDEAFLPAHINRGFTYLEQQNPAAAEKAMTTSLQIEPNQPAAYSLRGTARLNQNRSAEAIADYRRVVELAPQNPMSHADLGFALFFVGDYAAARESFASAIKLDPQATFLLPWRLASEKRIGNVNPSDYSQALAKSTKEANWVELLLQYQFGRIDERTLVGQVDTTVAEVRDAQYCEACYFIGNELAARGRMQDARAYWERGVEYNLPKLSAYRGAVYALRNTPAANR